MNKRVRIALMAALLAGMATAAQAGRPLATDDAGTAGKGTCQIEGWAERDDAERAYVLAGACGVADGLELGLDAARTDPRNDVVVHAGLALKWAPESAVFETAVGTLKLGAKLGLGATRPVQQGWRHDVLGALALFTLEPGAGVALHLNVGPERDRELGLTSTLLNGAVVWAPSDAALLFAEALTSDRRDINGGTVRTAGARWWVVKEKFGIDVTASRVAGSGGSTRWGIGFGWYGIGG